MSANGAQPVVHQPIPRRPFVNRASPEVLEEAQDRAQNQYQDSTQQQGPYAQAQHYSQQEPSSPSSPNSGFLELRPSNPRPAHNTYSQYSQHNPPQHNYTTSGDSSTAQSERGGGTSTNNNGGGGSDSISRAQSVLNLTSSTLYGIFSPAATGGREGSSSRLFEPGTPWGTGAETPARELFNDDNGESDLDSEVGSGTGGAGGARGLAESDLAEVRKASMSLLMLQRKRRRGESFGADGVSGIRLPPLSPGGLPAAAARRTSSATTSKTSGPSAPVPPHSTASSSSRIPISQKSRLLTVLSIIGRAGLLFGLGMGYGILSSRLRSETTQRAAAAYDDFAVSGSVGIGVGAAEASSGANVVDSTTYDALYDWWFLGLWGTWGLVLGTLLPWFDDVWHRTFHGAAGRGGSSHRKGRPIPETDWNVIVRGVGAFAGVVFAMRKLPWASAMQASLTLALANPFLWYILDRSKSGLLLATAVGLVGTVVLLTLNLDLMPNPAGHQAPAYIQHGGLAGALTGSLSAFHHNASSEGSSAAGVAAAAVAATASRLSSVESAETAIWMLSVMFCSCVCFGNIGRRLALRPT